MKRALNPPTGTLAVKLALVALFAAATAGATTAAEPERTMAVTIDDLPTGPPGWHSEDQKLALTEKLIAVLQEHQVPAVGFVNEDKLEVDGKVDTFRLGLLERWLDAGFQLGNHGYAHLDLHAVEPQEWMQDILRGERQLRPLLAGRQQQLRYFRHPYLRTGRTLEVKRETTAFLATHGYTVAPVTIDNQEWIFGRKYHEARGDAAARARIGKAYVEYMLDMTRYYEQQSLAITGAEIPQVLLVHAYDLNADWLGALLARLRKRGYRFVALEQALEHPAYATEDGFVGKGGITWLHRWAITQGMPGSTFAGEPGLPEWLR